MFSLCGLDVGANGFYGGACRLCGAAVLAGCCAQRALRPYVDSKVGHIGHFVRIRFVNGGIGFVSLLAPLDTSAWAVK